MLQWKIRQKKWLNVNFYKFLMKLCRAPVDSIHKKSKQLSKILLHYLIDNSKTASEDLVRIGLLSLGTSDILDQMTLCGAILCTVGRLASSLASTH